MTVRTICQELREIGCELEYLAALWDQMAPVEEEMRDRMRRMSDVLDNLFLAIGGDDVERAHIVHREARDHGGPG